MRLPVGGEEEESGGLQPTLTLSNIGQFLSLMGLLNVKY